MAIRVLLADDHTVVREGLRLLLETHDDIAVIGGAEDGREAVHQVQRLKPDIVVMDIAMPGLNGIEATRRIHETCPATQVIVLSIHATAEHIFRAFEAGARGYLVKSSAGKEVADAIRAVQVGRRYLSQRITDIVIKDFVLRGRTDLVESPIKRLSDREREVLQLVVEGKSSARIAEVLCVSPKTVETYRCRLMQKLGIRDLPGLMRFAIQQGLIPPE